jgi:simple sugar transport system permease protein
MNDTLLVRILASIALQAAPLMIAVTGETLTERAGVVNLSLDGKMLMAAMTGFVVAYTTDSLILGFLAAALMGALFALIVAFGSITLKHNQVAIGFVLTLLGADLSAFLGQNFTRLPGPSVGKFAVPYLKDLPVLGPIFFNQNAIFYFAILLVAAAWWWLFRTQPGLHLRGAGERPEAAFARGASVTRLRYLYTVLGGALVGVAGASYSLGIKIGWSEGHTAGLGWIALAIVIFGGWSPARGALGAVVFGATKALATVFQQNVQGVSVVAFNTLPWLLMIGVLLLVSSDWVARVANLLPPRLRAGFLRLVQVTPPRALGVEFGQE